MELPFYEQIGNINISGAWGKDTVGTIIPVAIFPTYVHSRMNAQKSCFTIHGFIKSPLSEIVDEQILKSYIIPEEKVTKFRNDLRMIGVTHSSVFTDLDHLSKDLEEAFHISLRSKPAKEMAIT